MYQMIDQMHHVIHQSAVIAKMLPEPSQQILSCHKYLCQVPNKTHEPQIYNTMQCQWSSYREMYVLNKISLSSCAVFAYARWAGCVIHHSVLGHNQLRFLFADKNE